MLFVMKTRALGNASSLRVFILTDHLHPISLISPASGDVLQERVVLGEQQHPQSHMTVNTGMFKRQTVLVVELLGLASSQLR